MAEELLSNVMPYSPNMDTVLHFHHHITCRERIQHNSESPQNKEIDWKYQQEVS